MKTFANDSKKTITLAIEDRFAIGVRFEFITIRTDLAEVWNHGVCPKTDHEFGTEVKLTATQLKMVKKAIKEEGDNLDDSNCAYLASKM